MIGDVFAGWEAKMRSLLMLGLFGLIGCGSDSGFKVFNSPPEAEITSHKDEQEVKEATEVLFRGVGADPDHDKDVLEASWQDGAEVLCDWAPLDEEGVTECTIAITSDFKGVTLLVRDPKDAVGSTNVSLKLQTDKEPYAEITAPTVDLTTGEEMPFFWGDESVELEGLVSDEEDAADTLTVVWSTEAEEELSMTPPDSSGTTRASGFLSEGTHTVTLMVADSAGNYTSDTLDVQVGPLNPAHAPDVTITSPEVMVGERRFYYGDETIEIEAIVTDDEDAGETLSITWDSDTDGELLTTTPDSDGTATLTAHLSEGLHTVTLTATDSDGQIGSDAINIEVGSDNTSPSCSLLTPEDGATGLLGDLVVFGGTVSDPDIPVDTLTVEWKDGDVSMGSSVPTSAGNVSLAISDLELGAHVVSMTVLDEMGATCTDQVIYIVEAPNTPPTVTVVSPSTGDVLAAGDPVLFDATVSDAEDDPSDLSISWTSDIDGVLSTAPADSSGYSRFTDTGLSVGSHAITLTVTDSEGAYTTAVMVIEIEEALVVNTPPVITLVSPEDGATVLASEPVVFSAVINDGEDAPSALTITWTSSIDGVLTGATPDALGTVSFTEPVLSLGTHIITVTAADTGGLNAMAMSLLTIEPVEEEEEEEEEEDFLEDGDELPPELEGGTYAGCADFDLDNLVIFGAIDARLFCACGFDEADNVKISSSGESDIDLDCLEIIDGDLEIDLCGANNIDLSSVASVGDGVNIHDNYDTEVIDLSAMTSVGGSFSINNNIDLEELNISALETIDGELQLNSNSSLASFAVPNLSLIEGSLRFSSNSGIEETHFESLAAVEGDFRFEHNHYVERVSLPALTELQGQMYIYNNDRLEDIVFTSLQEVSSSLEVQYNSQVESIDMSSLQVVNGTFQMYSLNQVDELNLPALEEVNGSFTVSNMNSLDFLSAPAFYDLAGSLTIRDNTDLAGVDLSSLECIEEFTVVGNNMTPEVLHALLLQLSCDEPGSEVIFRTSDGDTLCADGEDVVVSNLYVYAIDPEPLDLSCIVDITGRLEIEFSDATTIDLSRAAGVGDGVNIHDNYDTDEIWLDSVATVGGSFSLNNNISLSVLDIDALEDVGGELQLNSNSGLDTLYAPNLSIIQGSLRFSSNSGIELIDLPNLFEVEGDFRFEHNHYVEDLLLPGLEDISSQVYVYNNDRLNTINLEGLIETGSSLEIQYNSQVEHVFLDSLQKVNGTYQMYSLNQMSTLELPSLLEVNGSFTLSNNSNIEHFGAPLFHELTGSLTIRDNTDLQTVDLSSLECIEDFTIVGNDLTIDSHHALLLALTCADEGSLIIFRDTDADTFCETGETVVHDLYISPIDSAPVDLSCITEITGQVEMEFSKATSIDISNAVSIADGLNIHDNYDTDTIDFTSLVSVGDGFTLNNNRDLEILVIDSIETIGGQFEVNSNGSLSTLSAPNLDTIEGSLRFSSNSGIEEVSFDSLVNLEGDFRFEHNHYVESVALPAVNEVQGQMYIYNNDRLETIVFSGLTEVSSSLEIQYNSQVASVDLTSLQSVNGTFQMYSLNEMEELNLAALQEVNGSFTVNNCNSLLSLSAPVFDDLSGSLTIRDNTDLASIDLTSLTCVDDYTIVGNDMDDDDVRDLLLHIISTC